MGARTCFGSHVSRYLLALIFLLAGCTGQPQSGVSSGTSPTRETVTTPPVAVNTPSAPSPSAGSANGTGSWSTAGSMSTSRGGHSATLLPSGKVLIAGGNTGGFVSAGLASTELFDPATNTWSAAAPMNRPHAGHTATLLKSGKVLVVAGRSTGGDSNAAELYDPVTNSWSSAGSIAGARTSHAALRPRNGKVRVWGGFGPAGANPPAELYDPATNGWSVVPGTSAHFINVAIVLEDGRVLALGDIQNSNFQFAGILDPDSGVVTNAARPAISMARAVLLNSGKVLAYQNYAPGDKRATELYDPRTNTWSLISRMSIALFGPGIVLRDGRVLVTGSAKIDEPGCGTGCPNAELFDPLAGKWTLTKPMSNDRGEQTMTLLADGRVLVAGGVVPPNPDTIALTEIFDPGR